jgi:hypothetical protein
LTRLRAGNFLARFFGCAGFPRFLTAINNGIGVAGKRSANSHPTIELLFSALNQ